MKFDWISFLSQILKILGGFAVPSLLLNFIQYRNNNKFKKWESERELEKLLIEKEGLKSTTEKTKNWIIEVFKVNEDDIEKIPELQSLLKSLSKEEKILQRITAEEKYHNKILNS